MALLTRVRLLLPRIPIFGPSAATVTARETRVVMEQAVLLAQREIAQRTPVGATGILRGSIASEVRGAGAEIRGVVATAQAYGLAVEQGTRPHWAPIGPLLLWARRKLGDERAAYRVQWAIARRGTRAAHMFRDGAAGALPRIRSLFAALPSVIRSKLGG